MYVSRIGLGRWTNIPSDTQFARAARLRAVRGCLCVGIILHTALTSAQADVPIELVALWGGAGGRTETMVVAGNRAYFGVGPRLAVLDISDPTRPVELGRSPVLRGLVEEIVVSGDYAYVIAGSLNILDVSDPVAPSLVGEYAASVGGWRMSVLSVRGNYAYVGFEGQGNQLQVVDVSDPRSPKLVHAMELFSPTRFIHFGEHLFAVTDWPGVLILDLSNPEMPREVGHIANNRSTDVAVSGSHIYIYEDLWMDIYDVSNPEAPVFVTRYVDLWGTPEWIDVRNGFAYLLGGGNLTIVDVSDPSDPMQVSQTFFHLPFGFSGRFDWFETYILVPDSDGGIKVLDVSDPTAPVSAGRFELTAKVYNLGLSDGFVYVGRGMPNLHVFDVSVPADPRQVAEVRLEQPGGRVMTIDNSIVYLSSGRALHLISVADPTKPELWSSVEMSAYITDVAVAGQHALVVMQWDGVVVLDVSDPRAPARIGSYNEAGQLGNVSITGSAAFLFNSGNPLIKVLDISDPTAPFRMGYFYARYTGGWYGMTIRGNLAYVAHGSHGMSIIDISDPISPRWLGQHDTLWPPRDVNLSGNLAFIAVDRGGLEIVDISRPTAPTLLGRHGTFHRASSVSVSGSYAFVADNGGGLLIFRVTIRGDANCDGQINALDVEPFLLALFEPEIYSGDYPNCDINNGDINGDGQINASDIEPFIELLWGP